MSDGLDPQEVRSEHSGDYLRLARLWERRAHFSLMFAAVDSASYRDALIRRLDAISPARQITLAPGDSPLTWLERLHAAHLAGAARVHVYLEPGASLALAWWQQANLLRERLADAFPSVVLVWLSDSGIDAAAHGAPDLWNWREAVFTFTAPPPKEMPPLSGATFSRLSAVEHAEVQRRLQDITQYLERHGNEDAAAHLQLEAATAYERLGQWDESEASAREAAKLFAIQNNAALEAHAKGQIADILQARGQLDEALRIRTEEQLPVYERLGDVRSQAVTQGKIADILQARGELDEALRIRSEEQLPVFERLGDVREKAVTQGKIADILQARGELDEALRIRTEEQLPVYERLGDVRLKAITQGRIADILQARGGLDEALRIRTEEQLPVFERLGDVREKAVTQGKIADILQARGELDEALRIRTEEQLPVFERLGDVREKAVTQGKIADILQARGELDEALRIRTEEELPVYERLGDVREKTVTQGKIADILQARGELDEALRIRTEEQLPVYERLEDVREKTVTQGKIADILQARGELDEALALHAQRLPAAETQGDIDSIAHIKYCMARIRLKRGDHESGDLQAIHDDLADAFAIVSKLGRPDAIGHIGHLLARVLATDHQKDEALQVLDRAEAAFAKLGDDDGVAGVRHVRQAIAGDG